jgi:hypothetical protein
MFRRPSAQARPSAALLRNYLARARAIADAGGGNLWLIEPTLRPEAMPAFTEAVARHVAAHGVPTGEIVVLEGRTSARIGVLGAPTVEIVLPQEQLTPPATRS